jgi:hypothetical protein
MLEIVLSGPCRICLVGMESSMLHPVDAFSRNHFRQVISSSTYTSFG